MPRSGVVPLMEDDRFDDLRRAYELFRRVSQCSRNHHLPLSFSDSPQLVEEFPRGGDPSSCLCPHVSSWISGEDT
eukprot:scaffold155787_cov29-Tisochrysis_lutea.AAC.12